MTGWIWPNHDNEEPYFLNLTEIETYKPYLRAWCFFLVEERSDGVSEAGLVSHPVQACEPGLGDLPKPTAPAYFFG